MKQVNDKVYNDKKNISVTFNFVLLSKNSKENNFSTKGFSSLIYQKKLNEIIQSRAPHLKRSMDDAMKIEALVDGIIIQQ